MKSKILVLAITVIIVLSCFMLVACGDNTVKNKLSYGKKYLSEDYLNNENQEAYYLFNKNGTGVYHYYSKYDYNSDEEMQLITSYSINFRYIIDTNSEVVYCFYDSFEYDDIHNYTYVNPDNSDWTAVLTFTDKFLYSISAYPTFYLTEEFLSETIPNFAK